MANRGFLMRCVTWMAEQGIRQFIDVGAGFPAQRPTHEVARAVHPDCRVVYTDNDPAVVERGRRMLASVTGTAVIEADIRQPAVLFGHPDTARLIRPAEPTGLLVIAVTQFVPDEDDPWSLAAAHMAPLAPGSYLALSAATADHKSERQVNSVVAEYANTPAKVNQPRARRDFERFLVEALGGDWVLMRVLGDDANLISVFSRFEWECFLDGAKNGEFDTAGLPGATSQP